MRINPLSLLSSLVLVVALSACDSGTETASQAAKTTENQATSKQSAPVQQICSTCGSVVMIQPVTEKGESSGAGAVIGAVAGGLLGNQIGGGSGKKAATVVGAVGGAVAGNEIEKQRNAATYYAVTVKMEDGAQRVVNVGSVQGLDIGTKVEVVGNDLRIR